MSNEAPAAYTDGDIDTNISANPTLNDLVAARYSRRQTLMGGVSALTAAVFGGALVAACGDDDEPSVQVSVGGDVTAYSGQTVTLTATVGGTATRAVWTQLSGPPVSLQSGGDDATFTAPTVTAPTTLTFSFTASGPDNNAVFAQTSVTVNPAVLGFTAVPHSLDDIVKVPAGYGVTVLYRTGDPITADTPAYRNDGTDTDFAHRAGDHHDGMSFFGLGAAGATPDFASSTRGMLVLNHENINQRYLHVNGPTTLADGSRPEAEAIKEIECHGVSAIEIARGASGWSYARNSALNRRVTPATPVVFTGPAKGAPALRTRFAPDGATGRGTLNNCANGTMPWGSYATNEENWAGYFRRDAGDVAARGGAGAKDNVALARYGVREGSSGNYGWSTVTPADPSNTLFARWNVTASGASATADFRNEANQFGWVVEIDPFDPASAPRKRTALGRMNHEGCCPGRVAPGVRPAFYMGDDATNEYLYKFVSATAWAAADANPADRLATGDKYLDNGTLYVARFNADGTGEWLPLVFGQGALTSSNATYPFADQADVLINARLAADALGATKMDRPEWTAVNPRNGEMYLTLTNNSTRTLANTDAANPRYYNDPKGAAAQRGNPNGHIIRLRENGDTTEATAFRWDIYLFAAGADLDPVNINISGLDATNDLSSPDGLWFSRPTNPAGAAANPILWIETDDGAFTDVTNCMLLAAQPGQVGDGAARTITNTGADGATAQQATLVGKAPGDTLRRFLVGPKECEITGIETTPDGKALFVNIQHPGENGGPANITSNWPDNQSGTPAPGARPRSATIVITKTDGGVVGL